MKLGLVLLVGWNGKRLGEKEVELCQCPEERCWGTDYCRVGCLHKGQGRQAPWANCKQSGTVGTVSWGEAKGGDSGWAMSVSWGEMLGQRPQQSWLQGQGRLEKLPRARSHLSAIWLIDWGKRRLLETRNVTFVYLLEGEQQVRHGPKYSQSHPGCLCG